MTFALRILFWLRKIYQFIARPITVGVRTMLIQDEKVLLVRHVYQEGWFMPGGGIKRNETLEHAARRECQEEVGVEIQKLNLFGTFSNFAEWTSDHIVLFFSDEFTMTDKTDSEIAEKRFFPLDDLPESLGKGHLRRLKEYQIGMRQMQYGVW